MSSAAEVVKRGDGSTTKQILSAPFGSYFIWNNEYPQYAIDLAKALKRKDLVVMPSSMLNDANIDRLKGSESAVIVDHALVLNKTWERNLNSLRVPGRKVTQAVEEPNLGPEKLSADVIAWTVMGTGLIIRGANMQVRCRLKYQPPSMDGDPARFRQDAVNLMEHIADLISQRGSVDEGIRAPSQDATAEMDREQAVKVILNFLANPATPKALKKKVSDELTAVM